MREGVGGRGGKGGCLGTEAPCRMRSCQMEPLQLFIRAGGPGGGGCCSRRMLKTASQATHLCSWGSLYGMKHGNPPASRGMRDRNKEWNTEGNKRQTNRGKWEVYEASDSRYWDQNFLSFQCRPRWNQNAAFQRRRRQKNAEPSRW